MLQSVGISRLGVQIHPAKGRHSISVGGCHDSTCQTEEQSKLAMLQGVGFRDVWVCRSTLHRVVTASAWEAATMAHVRRRSKAM